MNSIFKISSIAFSLLFLSGLAFAQGEFLNHGESAVGIASAVAFSENSSSYGVALGYSFQGVVDIGLGIGRSYPSGSLSGKKYGNFIAPSLTFFLQKQDNSPNLFSIALSLSYQFVTLKQPVYIYEYTHGWPVQRREETSTTKTNAGSIAFSFARKYWVDKNPFLQTVLSLETIRSGETYQFGILFGFSISSRIKQAVLLAITPTVGALIISGQKAFVGGLEVDLVF